MPKGDTAHPDAQSASSRWAEGLWLDFMSALNTQDPGGLTTPFRHKSHLNSETTHGSLVPAGSAPSAHLLTLSRLSVLPSEDEDEAQCQRIIRTGSPQEACEGAPTPSEDPGAGRGDSILLFTHGTRIFGVSFLSLQKNGSLAFQITPFYLETWESQDLSCGFHLENRNNAVLFVFVVCFPPVGGLTVR